MNLGIYVSIDTYPQTAAKKLVKQCGLKEKVYFINGASSKLIPTLQGMTLYNFFIVIFFFILFLFLFLFYFLLFLFLFHFFGLILTD